MTAAFGYTRPGSLDEALRLIAADDGAKVIAGGQSLIPLMKLRLARPTTVVDIGRIGELRGVARLPDGRVAVGALTTYAELIDARLGYGVLDDALPTIGDVQVRNRGTIGGAVAHADPASDLPAALLSLDAEVVLRSATGERTTKLHDFFDGPFTARMDPGELVTRVVLPAPRDDAGSAYASLMQPASGYATAGVAAVVIRAGGTIAWAGIGVTGVSEHPYRAVEMEAALTGRTGTDDEVAAAADLVVGARPVNADAIHADATYRAAMAKVVARRAVEAALARIR